MVLVGGTMYAYYRQHDPGNNTEQIMLRTSTDGVTWSGETTVLDTAGTSPTARTNMISPGIVHDGAQFIMYYTKNGTVQRRTSANGTAWSAEAVTPGLSGLAVSHVDATRSADGRVHLFLQTIGAAGVDLATNQSNNGGRTIAIAKSNDGITFTLGSKPLLISEHMGQRNINRTCGLHETRNGKDYYRLWASCVSYGLATTAAEVQAEESSSAAESYYIGYTEGYDPNAPANSDKTSMYLAGDVISGGQVRAKRMGAFSIWGRFIVGVRGAFDILRTQEFRAGVAYIDGGNYDQTIGSAPPKWALRLGYIGKNVPALILGSRSDTTVASAALAFHNTSPGNARALGEGWQVSVNEFGHLQYHQRAADGTLTRRGYFDYGSGAIQWEANVVGSNLTTPGQVIATGLISTAGNAVKITANSTPASSADAAGTAGEIGKDDNYIFVRTATGWKRSALTTW